MAELKTENEKDAKVKRRLAKELQFLKERESRGVKEKEVRRKNVIAVLIKWVSNSLFLCAFLICTKHTCLKIYKFKKAVKFCNNSFNTWRRWKGWQINKG